MVKLECSYVFYAWAYQALLIYKYWYYKCELEIATNIVHLHGVPSVFSDVHLLPVLS